MRALYEHFRSSFIEGIEMQREETNKRRKLNIEANKQIGNGDHANGIKEEEQKNGHAEEKMEIAEEQPIFHPSFGASLPKIGGGQEEFEGLKCVACDKIFTDFEKIVFLDICSHIVCKECLSEQINLSYPEVKCLAEGCESKVQDFEVRTVLGNEEYEKLQEKMTNKALEGDQNMVKCKCGNMIEMVQGKIYYDIKNYDGKVINKVAAKHMSQHRVRCPECKNNFCTSCAEEPYHLGKTCAQFKREKDMKKCRFCGANLRNAKANHCSKKACKNESKKCCSAFLDCGHPCYGYNNEKEHGPCLHEDCVAKDEKLTLGQNADSYCSVCQIQGLGEKSVIQLGCKHIFHMDCIRTRLHKRWDALAISLKYAFCPTCNQWMEAPGHEWLESKVKEAKDLQEKIMDKCLQRAKHEGLDMDERLKNKQSEYFENLGKFAFDHLNYYECYECKDPYFGGHHNCGAAAQEEEKKEGNVDKPE